MGTLVRPMMYVPGVKRSWAVVAFCRDMGLVVLAYLAFAVGSQMDKWLWHKWGYEGTYTEAGERVWVKQTADGSTKLYPR